MESDTRTGRMRTSNPSARMRDTGTNAARSSSSSSSSAMVTSLESTGEKACASAGESTIAAPSPPNT